MPWSAPFLPVLLVRDQRGLLDKLEALTGYVGDTNGFYESVAAAQRVGIAQREVSLEPVAGPAWSGLGASPVPGAGGMGVGTPNPDAWWTLFGPPNGWLQPRFALQCA